MRTCWQFGACSLLSLASITATLVSIGSQAIAQTPSPGTLEVPARTVPVPSTVSPEMQKIIGAPLRQNWNIQPRTGEEWKPVAEAGAAATVKNVPGMLERLHVKVEKTTIDGVRAFIVTPRPFAPRTAIGCLFTCTADVTSLIPARQGCPRPFSWLASAGSR